MFFGNFTLEGYKLACHICKLLAYYL